MGAHRRWLGRSGRPAVIVVLALLLPVGARSGDLGEEFTWVNVGSKVRIVAPTVADTRLQGTVSEVTLDSVVVDASGDQRFVVPRRAITQLEVSTGRRGSTVNGMLIGAAAGLALSVVLPKCVNEGCTSSPTFDPVFAAAGALGGTLWGGLIGSLVKVDRWTSLPPDRVRLTVAPCRGGVRVGVSIGLKRTRGSRPGA